MSITGASRVRSWMEAPSATAANMAATPLRMPLRVLLSSSKKETVFSVSPLMVWPAPSSSPRKASFHQVGFRYS